jgi:hypothetical protein
VTIAFWIADQPGYVSEAMQSAASFKRHNPACATALFGSSTDSAFDFIYPLPARQSEHWYLDSVRYFNHALHTLHHDSLIYFDVDTYTLAPLTDLIALIGRFDLVGAHAPARETAPTVNPVPDAFPEINIGVLGIANNAVMKRFMEEWLKRYELYHAIYGNNDQAPLREALWYAKVVNLYVMPPEYNCRFGFGGFAALPVKVLHGRGMSFEAAEKIVNHAPGMRAWTNADLRQMS